MGEVSACSVSRRAFAAGHHGMPRSVPLCIAARREGRFRVRMCGVHVVDVVQRARASVDYVSISFACMYNRWYHKERSTGASGKRADPYRPPRAVARERG